MLKYLSKVEIAGAVALEGSEHSVAELEATTLLLLNVRRRFP